MNISEFEISEESKSDYLRTVQEFRKMGVRCVSKTYEDVAELKRDAYKFRYIKGNVGGAVYLAYRAGARSRAVAHQHRG